MPYSTEDDDASLQDSDSDSDEDQEMILTMCTVADSPAEMFLIAAAECMRPKARQARRMQGLIRVGDLWASVTNILPAYRLDISNQQYYEHFRMTKDVFHTLYNNILPYLTYERDPRGRKPLDPLCAFAATIHHLAVGGTEKQDAGRFAIAHQTDNKHIKRVVSAMYDHWASDQFIIPEGVEALRTIDDFKQKCRLPQAIGAVDGTYFKMAKRPSVPFADRYWCYKNFYGILIVAVVDAVGRFIYADIGRPASVGDSAAFTHTPFAAWIESREIFGPELDVTYDVADGDAVTVRPYLLADQAFTLSPCIMKCYGNPPSQDSSEQRFNDAVIEGRKAVECAFGRAKGRWQILKGTWSTNPVEMAKVATVCFALHNYCETASLNNLMNGLEDDWEALGGEVVLVGNRSAAVEESISGEYTRDFLRNYIMDRYHNY